MKRKRIRVVVTEKHIHDGKRGHCRLCPVALALKKKYDVAAETVYYGGYYGNTALLPIAAQKFIHNFDNGKPVKPFSFTIWGPRP